MRVFLKAHDAPALAVAAILLSAAVGLVASSPVGTVANPSFRVPLACIAPIGAVILVGATLTRGSPDLRQLSPRPIWLDRIVLVNVALGASILAFVLVGGASGRELILTGVRNTVGLSGVAIACAAFGAWTQWVLPFACVAVPMLAGVADDGRVRWWAWVLERPSVGSTWVIAGALFVAGNALMVLRECASLRTTGARFVRRVLRSPSPGRR